MIFSDRQVSISRQQIAKLSDALSFARADTGKHERLRNIEKNALESQIAEIEREIADYEALKSGSDIFSGSHALVDLPRILIQSRIAQGLSQTDLAARLNMRPQQIQRYEATGYMSASLARLIELANALNVPASPHSPPIGRDEIRATTQSSVQK